MGGLRALQAGVLLSAVVAWGVLLFRLGWAKPLAAILPFGVLVLFADRIRLRPDLLSFLAFPIWSDDLFRGSSLGWYAPDIV